MNSSLLCNKPKSYMKAVKVVLIICLCTSLVTSACSTKGKQVAPAPGSPVKLLDDSLAATTRQKTFRFSGTGSVHYVDIDDTGTFTVSGEYKAPAASYLKLDISMGDARWHTETLYQNQDFYTLSDNSWRVTPFDPNLLMQPAYKPVNFLLDQLREVGERPFTGKDFDLNGKKLKVIRIKSNPNKLRTFIKKEFDRTLALEPEKRQGIMHFLKNLAVEQDYTLYVDPDSNYITRIRFSQRVKINLQGTPKLSLVALDLYLTDFGHSLEIPSAPQRKNP